MNNLLSIIADVKRRPAAAYIELVETALGSSMTETQKTAIGAFIEAEQVGGRWNAHGRLYLPIWGNAAANAICLKSLTSGTFAGTVTHGAGYVQSNGSTGYFSMGISPSAIGLTNTSAGVFYLTRAAQGSGSEVVTSVTNNGTLILRGDGDFSLSGGTLDGGAVAKSGIVTAQRVGGTSSIYRRITTGRSALATGTPATTQSTSTGLIYVMCRSSNNLPVFSIFAYTQQLGAYGANLGFADADDSAFTLNLKTLWETCTGLTLP